MSTTATHVAPASTPMPRAAPASTLGPHVAPTSPNASSSAPRTALASHFAQPPPPLCTSDDIRLPSRSTPTSGHRSTTPSPWLVTPTAPTRWSPIVPSVSPSLSIVYSSPLPLLPRHCLRSQPLSVARSQTPTGVALWRSTRPCCLTAHGTWFLGLLGPMSSSGSRSSSTSSRWMALLTSTRLIGSSRGSLNALGWTTMRPSAPSSSLPLSRLC
jgi:hypothetical protein